MKRPEDCADMADIRAEIDRIDAALVKLFAERASYIDRAAEVKAKVDLPARIGDRVEEVVQNVRAPRRGAWPAARSGGEALAAAHRLVDRARRGPAWSGQPEEGQR